MVETIENSLVASLLKILNSFFKPYIETEANKVHPEQIEQLENNLEGLFLYACIWSIGCTTDYEGRLKFNTYLHELIKENKYIFKLVQLLKYQEWFMILTLIRKRVYFTHGMMILKIFKLKKINSTPISWFLLLTHKEIFSL